MKPLPTGDDYTAVWGSSATDLWMATATGSIVHSDGVHHETRFQHDAEVYSAKIWGRSSSEVMFAFDEGDGTALVQWDGSRFRLYSSPYPKEPRINAMTGTAGSLLLVGPSAVVERRAYRPRGSPGAGVSYDGPRSVATSIPAGSNLIDVWSMDDDDVWVMDQGGEIYHGSAIVSPASPWTHVNADGQSDRFGGLGLYGTSPKDIWAFQEEFAAREMVFRHYDGQTWTRSSISCFTVGNVATRSDHRHVWGVARDDIWVIGASLGCTGHWDGTAWSERPLPSDPAAGSYAQGPTAAIWSNGAETVAAGRSGHVDRWGSDNAWHVIVAGSNGLGVDGRIGTVTALSAPAEDDVYAIESTRRVVHYDGRDWQPLPPITPPTAPASDSPRLIYASGPNDVWVTGSQYGFSSTTPFIAHWDGQTWDEHAATDAPAALWGNASNDVWAGGSAGVERWDGAHWNHLPLQVSCVRFITGAGKDVWFSGAEEGDCYGRLLLWHWDGSAFEPMPTFADDGTLLFGLAANDVWMSGPLGLGHWDGARWTPHPLPRDVTVQAAWGGSSNDVWFVGGHGGNAAALRWDGTHLARDVGGSIGGELTSLTGAGRSLFAGGAGVLHGAP